jgi:hypothetical protein
MQVLLKIVLGVRYYAKENRGKSFSGLKNKIIDSEISTVKES